MEPITPRQAMRRYRTEHLMNLVNTNAADDFQRTIEVMEGMPIQHAGSNGERDVHEREQARFFRWGHDHNFGTFQMKGAMGDRHLTLMQWALDNGLVVYEQHCVDVGCWTGGTSLLMAALGARRVTAFDEVPTYPHVLQYLAESFGVARTITTRAQALYNAREPLSAGVVWCTGVLYHLSDPLVGLLRLQGMLKQGGSLVLETALAETERSSRTATPLCEYQGPSKPGWNWWFPNVACVRAMLHDVGFEITAEREQGKRYMCIATNMSQSPIMTCGRSDR